MSTNRYEVQGMKCAGCVQAATAALEQLPGYRSAQFDLAAGTLLLDAEIAPPVVVQVLTERGYPTRLTAA